MIDFDLYGREHIQKLIFESTSVSEVLRKLDLPDRGMYHRYFTKYIKESNYDTSTLLGRHIKRYNDKGIPRKQLSELLCENSTGNSNMLRKRLIECGVKKPVCENPDCGISEWHGEPIVLQLHHINGDHYDNRIENLVLLCPNCHSQTSNWCSKNSIDLNKRLSEIAIDESKIGMENLLEYEKARREEIVKNRIKYGNYRVEKKEKIIKYCEQCGNEIKRTGKRFCSVKCREEYDKQHQNVKTEDIIEKAKECTSLLELSRFFKMSDNGIKKRLKQEGVYVNVKQMFEKNKKLGVLQFTLDGTFLREWKNGMVAGKELDLNIDKIYSCCNGHQKTSGGFIWKWKNK